MRIAARGLELELSPVSPLDHEDWCRVQVAARVPGFQANLVVYLQGADLLRFRDGIDAMSAAVGKSHELTLASAEPGISLTLSMQTLGGLLGKYELQGEFVEGGAPTLSGGFEMDQSYLRPMSQDIDELLEKLRRHET